MGTTFPILKASVNHPIVYKMLWYVSFENQNKLAIDKHFKNLKIEYFTLKSK